MATLGRRSSRHRLMLPAAGGLLILGLGLQFALVRGGSPAALEDGLGAVARPFLALGSGVGSAASTFWTAHFSASKLEEENALLREELIRTRILAAQDRAASDLKTLTESASIAGLSPAWSLQPVAVLATPGAGGRQFLWLDIGALSGARRGMVLVGAEGVLGLVEDVQERMTKVRLVTDEKSAWGAEVAGRGELGLLRGTADPGLAELHFDRTVTTAEEGDVVVTSGMAGSLAPAGIPFGTIEKMSKNRKGEPMALVRLTQEPGRLRSGFLLLEPRRELEAVK